MVRRIFVEKKPGYDIAAQKTLKDINSILNINASDVKIFIRYDVDKIDDDVFEKAKTTIFSEPAVDNVYDKLPYLKGYEVFCVEYLDGLYNQREDSAEQCVQVLSLTNRPLVKCATIYAISDVNQESLQKIKNYLINNIDSTEIDMELLPETLYKERVSNTSVPVLTDFIKLNETELENFHKDSNLVMSLEDLKLVQQYFIDENKDPTETEIKVIDTFWSDHCRHTTFYTHLTDIQVQSDNPHLENALKLYQSLYKEFNSRKKDKYPCLMDIATIALKKLVKEGKLDNLDEFEDSNACSIEVDVDVDGENQKWLVMFKNGTSNHPTELEPFGGAATSLGGAIRDPLSARVYVYQAMRISGAGDPREDIDNTLKGKLPQRLLSTLAAQGYSNYSNQIGVACGFVNEMYHENYKAKRLESSYVIGAAPKDNIVRQKPKKGDIVVLLGGQTGRDGCGCAVGASRAQTEDSIVDCGAEVQKGNPIIERKIQRLFRNSEASKLIIKCNDLGAGGLCVGVGKIVDGVDINLDLIPTKYNGLTGTELAISESQERMVIVLKKENLDKFIELAKEENLTAVAIAEVTNNGHMRMFYANHLILDIKKEFLDTNGARRTQSVKIKENTTYYLDTLNEETAKYFGKGEFTKALLHELSRLNVCSQKGLIEMFDSTIGASSILMPFGGKYNITPSIAMAAKLPVDGTTDTATVSSYGCSPYLMSESPFVGAIYSIVLALSKQVALGVDIKTVRMSLQEFFKKLNNDETRWAEPVSALLGALYAQINLKVAAIGGKDSMSGSFGQLDVPPTLISYACGITKASTIITNVIKRETTAKHIYHVPLKRDDYGVIDFEYTLQLYEAMHNAIESGKIVACNVVEEGGVISAVFKSCLGNKVGTVWEEMSEDLFAPRFGDFVVQAEDEKFIKGFEVNHVATINDTRTADICGSEMRIAEAVSAFENTLESVYPTVAEATGNVGNLICCTRKIAKVERGIVSPRVLIPVFPGTSSEYDMKKAFEKAGAKCDLFIIKNRSSKDVEDSIEALCEKLQQTQILALAGGFSSGSEPDGAAKLMTATLSNKKVAEQIMKLLYERDGLAIGISNGFQALIKLGLVPYGDIRQQNEFAPTLAFNNIARHVSSIVKIRVATNKTPWFSGININDEFMVPVSHNEGRFVASDTELEKIIKQGLVATQYVDILGNATMKAPYNPNGSMYGIEGIISQDGRILGKMGYVERIDDNLYKNVDGKFDMKLFESGVKYFE